MLKRLRDLRLILLLCLLPVQVAIPISCPFYDVAPACTAFSVPCAPGQFCGPWICPPGETKCGCYKECVSPF